jgi:hypothetical protein
LTSCFKVLVNYNIDAVELGHTRINGNRPKMGEQAEGRTPKLYAPTLVMGKPRDLIKNNHLAPEMTFSASLSTTLSSAGAKFDSTLSNANTPPKFSHRNFGLGPVFMFHTNFL